MLKKVMMNEERTEDGLLTRVVLRNTEAGNVQIDVFADGNQTGQEYTVQEFRMILELANRVNLDYM